jgi:hypothetical protein
MNRPASGRRSIDGFQFAIASGLNLISVGVDIPMMKHNIPLNPTIAPMMTSIANDINAPITIKTILEIRKFSLLFFI